MAGSSAGNNLPFLDQQSSSSSQSLPRRVLIEDDSDDDDDPAVIASASRDVLADDPFDVAPEGVVTFKRKQKQSAGSRFLSAFTGSRTPSRHATPSPRSGTPTVRSARAHGLNSPGGNINNDGNSKDGGPLDWYVEGPGRRVGYENLTAIDWIFEYTKERQRLKILYSSATGLLGYVQQFVDASQIWVLLILTGLSAGVFAASIDVTSDWLGDIKTGYCSSRVDGGKFYLNKVFCCYGYDDRSQCSDWVPWSLALHVTSAAGKWFLEYIFFIMFSVRIP